MKLPRVQPRQALLGLALLGLLFVLAPAPVARAGVEPQAAVCSGYYYTVKLGDTWSKIARSVGAPVSVLKAANPQAVRPHDLIYAGEKLCVPSQGGVQQGGYWYQVKPGDTWNTVSRQTGVPVRQLWNANPLLVNRRLWLYIGQRVWIPAAPKAVTPEAAVATPVSLAPTSPATAAPSNPPAAAPEATQPATAAPVAATVPAPTTTAVPPTATAVLPTATAVLPTATAVPPTATAVSPTATAVPPTPTATPTAIPTAMPTALPPALPPASPTAPPTALPTASPTVPASIPTAGAPVAPVVSLTATVSSPLPAPVAAAGTARPTLPPVPADCPKTFAAYPDAVAAFLNRGQNTPAKLQDWLVACRAVSAEAQGVTVAPMTAPRAADVVVVIHDPTAEVTNPQGMLLVYHGGARGYTLGHRHVGQGRINLLQAADLNADGKPDLIYTDASCGAHTCFGTLFVDSWDGKAYVDMITGEPTMAEPEYILQDTTSEGQGKEIVVHGGVISSVGAGPQRAWTETYTSPKGAPYLLFSQVYDPSTCLYHKILDADRAFDAWALDGFEPAIEAYKAAVADAAAQSCGTIKDEVATLRDFARFRLLVADVAAGLAVEGLSLPAQITNPALKGAATTFLDSYRTNTSVIQACRDTTKYAEANPASWQFLADWGYANPSFTAQALCPLN